MQPRFDCTLQPVLCGGLLFARLTTGSLIAYNLVVHSLDTGRGGEHSQQIIDYSGCKLHIETKDEKADRHELLGVPS
jgi:hypothetical protein